MSFIISRIFKNFEQVQRKFAGKWRAKQIRTHPKFCLSLCARMQANKKRGRCKQASVSGMSCFPFCAPKSNNQSSQATSSAMRLLQEEYSSTSLFIEHPFPSVCLVINYQFTAFLCRSTNVFRFRSRTQIGLDWSNQEWTYSFIVMKDYKKFIITGFCAKTLHAKMLKICKLSQKPSLAFSREFIRAW